SAPEFFGQGIAHDEAFAIMDRAWDAGITWFDTADAYGGGTSETWIGEWIAARGHRPVLTTKTFNPMSAGADSGLAPDRIRRQLESSLARLGVDCVDLYLAHEPDESVPLADTVAAFEQLKDEKLIGSWGLSNYEGDAVRAVKPSLVQNSFSLLDQDPVRDVCRDEGIRYVPFGPLAGGWLTGKYRRDEAFPEGSRMTQRPGPYERYRNDRVFDALEALEAEAQERGVEMAALAFAWVLAVCDGAVCGPNRAAHLDPILQAREIELTDEDVQRIGGLFA
ncbi:MAG TPA: aldo/keto reductase, partial [Gaiellaceae bacterium]|nr:aldo/keto reductase [Gaiellaceae bacterium]